MICNLTLTNFLFRKNMGLLVPPVRRPVSPTLHYRISSAEALWFLNCSDKRFEERLEGDYIESKHGSIILHGWEVTITRYQILSNKVMVMVKMKYFSGASYLFNSSSFLYQWIVLQIKLMTWVSSDVSVFSY
ncbi:hypothetical protein NC651_018533 [Populus alba x Populus x berolinensis]|nr:hypothetical protein NC651_018533 [Populus alba x Populus x berolinensis]